MAALLPRRFFEQKKRGDAVPGTPTLVDLMPEPAAESEDAPGKRKYEVRGCAASSKRARTEAARCSGSDYGKFKMRHRVHIDQVPLCLGHNPCNTFVFHDRSDMPRVSGLAGAGTMFGTLQVEFHGDTVLPQPKLGHFIMGAFFCVVGFFI